MSLTLSPRISIVGWLGYAKASSNMGASARQAAEGKVTHAEPQWFKLVGPCLFIETSKCAFSWLKWIPNYRPYSGPPESTVHCWPLISQLQQSEASSTAQQREQQEQEWEQAPIGAVLNGGRGLPSFNFARVVFITSWFL